MARILICGDRNWLEQQPIEQFIINLPKDTLIIEGDCYGADGIAGEMAAKHGLNLLKFPAEWNKYGRKAGPIRNQQMLEEGNPTHVIAFHRNLSSSKGTKDMVNRAVKARIYTACWSGLAWNTITSPIP